MNNCTTHETEIKKSCNAEDSGRLPDIDVSETTTSRENLVNIWFNSQIIHSFVSYLFYVHLSRSQLLLIAGILGRIYNCAQVLIVIASVCV